MKMSHSISKSLLLLFSVTCIFVNVTRAQDPREERLKDDAENAKAAFIQSNNQMQQLFDDAYGYAILPNVGKGAAGIGGAAGSGIVYEKGKMTGTVKMKQLSFGLHIGGEAFREVIFFEDKETFERFKTNELEFTAQTSATAIKDGNVKDAGYQDGIIVFTQKKTGLMYDASIGGQKFNYDAF